ncbi:MAG: hypothetical protein ACE5R6_21430 [Candidatus Heimdallarchaeota archaeon]
MEKPEPKKKARISLAIDQDFLAWIDQMIEKGVFANEATPYIELQLS